MYYTSVWKSVLSITNGEYVRRPLHVQTATCSPLHPLTKPFTVNKIITITMLNDIDFDLLGVSGSLCSASCVRCIGYSRPWTLNPPKWWAPLPSRGISSKLLRSQINRWHPPYWLLWFISLLLSCVFLVVLVDFGKTHVNSGVHLGYWQTTSKLLYCAVILDNDNKMPLLQINIALKTLDVPTNE